MTFTLRTRVRIKFLIQEEEHFSRFANLFKKNKDRGCEILSVFKTRALNLDYKKSRYQTFITKDYVILLRVRLKM